MSDSDIRPSRRWIIQPQAFVVLFLVVLALLFCSYFLTTRRNSSPPSLWRVRSYSSERIAAALLPVGYTNAFIVSAYPTSDAEGLILHGGFGIGTNRVCWIVRGGTVRCVTSPGAVCYADEQGRLIAWFDADRVYFTNGYSLRFRSDVSSMVTDVTGKYFAVVRLDGSSWLGRISNPSEVIWSLSEFTCTGIKLIGEKIFLFGFAGQSTVCLILVTNGAGFNIAKKVEVDEIVEALIRDVDPGGETLLFMKGFGPFAKLYIYDIKTGKRAKCKLPCSPLSAFLRSDPISGPGPLVSVESASVLSTNAVDGP